MEPLRSSCMFLIILLCKFLIKKFRVVSCFFIMFKKLANAVKYGERNGQ
jgi:hypothetical protein